MHSDRRDALRVILERAESNLAENVMPFWATHSWDEAYGGFLTRLDREGRWLDTSEKVMLMQVRMIASLSIAHRHGLRDRGYLELAAKGFEFLTAKMWDEKNGGFYFSVARDGQPKSTRKNTDFHAYAITGLVEYYRASGSPDALAWARRVYDVLLAQAADGDRGFIEDFDEGVWPVLNAEQMGLGSQQKIKTIDMHTNMLEALAYLAAATQDPAHMKTLRDLLRLICEKGIHHEHGCTISAFDYDWNPVADAGGNMTTSYGLNVELAWLMLEAVEVLEGNIPPAPFEGGEKQIPPARFGEGEPYRGLVLGLVDHALSFGFDWERGGLAGNGPMTGHVLDSPLIACPILKPWWAQAELLNALIDAYAWTRGEQYLDAFIKLFDWIWNYQIDHEHGDWYQDVRWDTCQPLSTDKGGEWKTAFHVSRALTRVAEGIRNLEGEVGS
jgi:mannose 2-epimerase